MKRKVLIIISLTFLVALTYLLFAQNVELIFSHKFHAEDVEAECADCHKATESKLAADNLLPSMETCYNCHDEDDTECSVCHKDPDNAIEYPRITDYIAKFSHEQHVSDKVMCSRCHENVQVSENIFDKHLPKMANCLECHTNTGEENFCYTCHSHGEELKPADHNLVWEKDHGLAAASAACDDCHTKDYCLDCHKSDNLNHEVHPLNYVNNHGIYAKGNKDNCYTCHEEQAFCVDCHQKRMVMPRNHSYANWSNTTTGGGHARSAKLDLDSCMSCHSDAQGDPVCVVCHSK
ncbi:hypothetical protein B6I21_02180 [candidate division KSB1 bacterium 4572_119]|nr:MAG: hypothetical protein B6I21_02180 [candidate division KSB1 bacterium 4572_119]